MVPSVNRGWIDVINYSSKKVNAGLGRVESFSGSSRIMVDIINLDKARQGMPL